MRCSRLRKIPLDGRQTNRAKRRYVGNGAAANRPSHAKAQASAVNRSSGRFNGAGDHELLTFWVGVGLPPETLLIVPSLVNSGLVQPLTALFVLATVALLIAV